MTNSTPVLPAGGQVRFPALSGVLQFHAAAVPGCDVPGCEFCMTVSTATSRRIKRFFTCWSCTSGPAVPRGPTARAVPPGTDVPACADHIAEELIAVVDLAVLLVIRENLLTEHELVAAVPVFDRNEPRHAGQGDQQTAETVVVQLPVLGEQRYPSAANPSARSPGS